MAARAARPSSATGHLGEPRRAERRVSPHGLVMAWMLAKSPVVIGIPGGRRQATVLDSVAAADLELTPAEVDAIDKSFATR